MTQTPLDYRTPTPSERAGSRIGFSLGMALPVALFVGVLSIILIFVIPRFETIFKDFGTRLPLVTTVVLNFALWFRSAYYAWPIVICLPLLAGLFAPKSSGAQRWLRLLLVLVFGGIVLLVAAALFLPLLSLIDNMSGGKR